MRCEVQMVADKTPKTAEELAAIAFLDRLRSCDDEVEPMGLPLACVVNVVDYKEVPKANERYAMATVEGGGGRKWRLCIRRYYLDVGMRALFVSRDAVLPPEDVRFANQDVCKLHERVFRFGFGVKVRRLVPFVKRNIYCRNSGVLYPLDDFCELSLARVGEDCAAALQIENEADIRCQAAMQQSKKQLVVQPIGRKDDFLAKVRLHRKRYGW